MQASRQARSSPLSICGSRTDSSSRLSTPSKRFKKDCVLTAEGEKDVAEWVRDNECFYNKKLKLYRHTEKKTALWEAKAAELGGGIDVGYLILWYKSMRIRYGKLSKRPSGSGSEDPTKREIWIMQKFGFLKNYISRQKGRQLGGLTERIAALRPVSGDESANKEVPEEVPASLSSTSEPVSRRLSTTSMTSITKNSARKPMESTLCDCAIQSDRLVEHVVDLISEHDVSKDSKTQFGLFITSMIPKIDDSLLTSYMDEAYGRLMRYVHRMEQICQQQFQQSYQSQQQFQQQPFAVHQYPQQHLPAPQYQQPQQFTQHHYPQQQQQQ